jgi:predicted NAD-dependent protein-ADP-ribosyltransferase YbiA (DUF1768 family)
MNNDIINVADENSKIGCMLSLFKKSTFEFGGIVFNSIESFLQAIKFDTKEKQIDIAQLEAYKARMKGKKLTKKLIEDPFIYWEDKKIQIHSKEYYAIIYEAIKQKFVQNIEEKVALLLTEKEKIIFDNGFEEPKFNTFPNNVFIEMLHQIREELKIKSKL